MTTQTENQVTSLVKKGIQLINNGNTVLFLAAHTDDVELACGATLVRCLREGAEVFYVALTSTDDYVQLEEEAHHSMKTLGIKQENAYFYEFPNMQFDVRRQEILRKLERVRDELQPDIVFCPSRRDLHQDHYTTAIESLRAFKKTANIFGYDICWNMVVQAFDPNFYVEVTKKDIIKKFDAIKCYKSQKGKDYMNELLHEGQLRFRGGMVGVEFAEAFESYRQVWKQ